VKAIAGFKAMDHRMLMLAATDYAVTRALRALQP
jgi:hypothetical protein